MRQFQDFGLLGRSCRCLFSRIFTIICTIYSTVRWNLRVPTSNYDFHRWPLRWSTVLHYSPWLIQGTYIPMEYARCELGKILEYSLCDEVVVLGTDKFLSLTVEVAKQTEAWVPHDSFTTTDYFRQSLPARVWACKFYVQHGEIIRAEYFTSCVGNCRVLLGRTLQVFT